MFMGEYAHSIDAKGRVILPADFRQELGVSFIITKGLDGSLFLFPQAAWDEFAAKLRTLSIADPNARAFARFFIAGARTLECDKQGRFLVPANLRAYANIGLKQDVILTGAARCGTRRSGSAMRVRSIRTSRRSQRSSRAMGLRYE